MTRSRNINRKRWVPSAAEIETVRREFPNTKTAEIAQCLGVAYHQVTKLAQRLGVSKTDAFLSGDQSGRLDGVKGSGTRFQKGNVPWSKGRAGIQLSPRTQFKPGMKPRNYAPVGSMRVNQGIGYLQIKLTDTGYPPRDWVMYHRMVWERVHGPVPPGHLVVFQDGRRRTDPAEVTIDVLECVSRQEHMRRHTFHQYGPEIAKLVQLRSALARQINKKDKQA